MYDQLREVWNEMTAPGAPFEVEEVLVRGVALRAYKNAPATLRDVWLGSAGHGDKDYLVYEDERWTFTEAHRDVASIAAWLVDRGVAPGDRVAIAMRNYPEWLLCYWAIVSIGATCVGMNAWWTAPEMTYGLEDADPKVLICDGERLAHILANPEAVASRDVVAVRTTEALPDGVIEWSELLGSGRALPEATIDPDSDACVFYTSGTTGRPKGAQLTHRGCTNNLYSIAFWNLTVAAASARAKPAGAADDPPSAPVQLAALVCTPLFHVTANNCIAHSATIAGGKLVHMYKWDAGKALELVESESITNLSGVPTMAREILAHPDFEKRDTSSLKALGGGGAQIQPDLVEKIDRHGTASPSTGYGMTEVCGIITANSAEFFVDKPASAGPAMPVFETRCIDSDGKPVEPGEIGELCVRGAQVIRGYLNRPEATDEAIQDGWLRTGDIAKVDEDGFIFIVDRAKDMVLRGGENVFCAEVEAAIASHPAVLECAVFGIEDERLGEDVAAAVVVNPDLELSAEALRAWCSESLAKYKIPQYLWLLSDPLPRNASGKFLKKQLREDLDPTNAV